MSQKIIRGCINGKISLFHNRINKKSVIYLKVLPMFKF